VAESPVRDLLAEVLRTTGEAHHKAYVATDGEDPEWALLHAEHLQPTVASTRATAETRISNRRRTGTRQLPQ
jgi:hypothetical protein